MPDRFREHRSRLAKHVGTNGIAVIPAAREAVRNHDVRHPFRQNSDFFYLTGFEEPDAVAVITPGHDDGEFHLFVHPRDRETEVWNGYRAGVEGAVQFHRADTAYPLSDLDKVLTRLLIGRDVLFFPALAAAGDGPVRASLERAFHHRTRFGGAAPTQVMDLSSVLSELRLVKGPSEIESLAAACELSAEGHREAMRFTRPGLFEYQVQAAMEYVWREGGSVRNGYPSIVASGPNAIVLHYEQNDRMIEDGDLVLIDAGAEVDMYSADITRTFPAGGSFTPAQRSVYEVVLTAHHEAMKVSRPHSTLGAVSGMATRTITEGLVDLGVLPASVDDSLAMHHYREFFMHGTSHWLGLDVHDAGVYRHNGSHRSLEPGMVFTVEPGIYIAADRPEVEFAMLEYDLDEWTRRRIVEGREAARAKEAEERENAPKVVHAIPDELLGIGVRIEDDVLITLDGHENLTGLVPVDPGKIEALCQERSWLERT